MGSSIMLLAIDIGNTNISFGILRGKRIVGVYSMDVATSQAQLRLRLKKILDRIQRKFPHLKNAILCSVVPKVLDIIERMVIGRLKIQTVVVGRDIKVPIKNNYHNPRQVGQDRLVCAYAAECLYGVPAIVIDLGTAITFDVISKKGTYEGGIIVPGIRLSAESLFQKTALLPKIESIKGPHTLIGKNTQESILSGLFYGYGSLCHGLIERMSKEMKGKPKVIVTGGHTQLMKKYISNKITAVDKNLVFKGLQLLMHA